MPRPKSNYPKSQDYLESTWAQLTKWAKRHHVGGLKPQDWEQLITEQWQLHYPESQYLFSMQHVKFIISVVRGFVALLKLELFYKARPLKNGSSHTDGASTKMPQYPFPMFS